MKYKTVAFVGLGAMGKGMAANLQKAAGMHYDTVLVWNRTPEKSRQHAAETGTTCVEDLSALHSAHVIFTCLPTSKQVAEVAAALKMVLKPGTVLVDCTSGSPKETLATAALLAENQIDMVDCPVSGGPAGAASGHLTAMVGGSQEAVNKVAPIIAFFAQKKVVRCGKLGSGHAVKAVNNALNVAHLAIASEGLLALAKLGVAPDVALAAINGSSGRSLQTQERIPNAVLTRKFDYGFALGLMAKDVGIAAGVCSFESEDEDGNDAAGPPKFFPLIKQLMEHALLTEGYGADYTRLVRPLEAAAGIELTGSQSSDVYAEYVAPPYVAQS
jgi:3-hydroxyisobutyrate dehydrogenase